MTADRDEYAAARGGRGGGVLNRDVRACAGVHGQIVIVGAYCPRCECEVMPAEAGGDRCPWCSLQILDLDRLLARPLLEQIRAIR
jgi:hypothetical protein